MNAIEKDIRAYLGIPSNDSVLEHYGTKRHSGRYPWGSGDNPYQHSGDFLSRVDELKKKGLSEKDILETINNSLPDEYKMGLTEFRIARQKAGHDRKALEYDQIRALMRTVLHEQECKAETARKHERWFHPAWFQSLWAKRG